jgi:hypothetical protein
VVRTATGGVAAVALDFEKIFTFLGDLRSQFHGFCHRISLVQEAAADPVVARLGDVSSGHRFFIADACVLLLQAAGAFSSSFAGSSVQHLVPDHVRCGFTEIVMTPQAGGPHHTLMLFPLDLLACFAAAFVFVNSLPVWGRRIATVFCGIALLIWAGFQINGLQRHFRCFGDANLFRAGWSPRVEQLADYLNTNGKQFDAIYCVDWGIGQQMRALCRRDIRQKLRDIWPMFKNWSAERTDADTMVKAWFPPQRKTLYLAYTDENSVFAAAKRNFSQMNTLAGNPARRVTTIPPALGAVYELFASGTEQVRTPPQKGNSLPTELDMCWRAPLILITCAGILTKNVEPISQAQSFLFSSEIALSRARQSGSPGETSPELQR